MATVWAARILFGAILSASGFAACSGGGGTTSPPASSSDTTPPTISSTSPANNATGVSVLPTVTATFSEPINPLTLTSTTFTLKDGNGVSVPGTLASAGVTVTFIPSANLGASTTYSATVTGGVKDTAGNSMAAAYTWSFTTGTRTIPLTINAASCSRDDVDAAISSAIDGDTVMIPAGACTWLSGLSVAKAISIVGAGGGKVQGYSTSSVSIGTGSKTFTVESGLSWLAGEAIRAVNTNNGDVNNMTGTVAGYSGTTLTLNVASTSGSGTHTLWTFDKPGDTILTHNAGTDSLFTVTEDADGHTRFRKFDVVRGAATGPIFTVGGNEKPVIFEDMRFRNDDGGIVFNIASIHGVIARCSFINTYDFAPDDRTEQAIHLKPIGITSSWASPSTMGVDDTTGENNFYLEDNTFVGFFTQVIDTDDNSRSVIRYNSFNHSGITSHGQDTSAIGGRHMELYNNVFYYDNTQSDVLLPNSDYLFFIRGLTGVITDNIIPDINNTEWGDKAEFRLTVMPPWRNAGPNACWTGGWPVPHQIGQSHDGVTTIVDPLYIWSNSGSGNHNNPDVSEYTPNECGATGSAQTIGTFLQPGRDYVVGVQKPGYTKYVYPHPLVSVP